MSSSVFEKLGYFLPAFEVQTKLVYSYKKRVFRKYIVKNQPLSNVPKADIPNGGNPLNSGQSI